MIHIFSIVLPILVSNGFLIVRYRQKKIRFITDMLARMAGVSFFILYICHQYALRAALHIKLDSALHILSWINWVLIMGIFAFFIVAYLIRTNPVVRANGLLETLLPLCCAVTPTILLETSRWVPVIADTIPWKLAAFAFLITGHAITLLSFLYLGRAFSIVVQARYVVQRGPYRYIRHPIYVGESIAIVGILLNAPNWINLLCVVLWLVAQYTRARFEEQKLAATFDSYAEYKRRTGAWFPRNVN